MSLQKNRNSEEPRIGKRKPGFGRNNGASLSDFGGEAEVMIAAFAAGRRGTHVDSLLGTVGAVEEFLPFHVADVLPGEFRKGMRQEPGKLVAAGETQIAPQVFPASAGADHDFGKPGFRDKAPGPRRQQKRGQICIFRQFFPGLIRQGEPRPREIIAPERIQFPGGKPQTGGQHAFMDGASRQEACEDGAIRVLRRNGRGRTPKESGKNLLS